MKVQKCVERIMKGSTVSSTRFVLFIDKKVYIRIIRIAFVIDLEAELVSRLCYNLKGVLEYIHARICV